LLPLLERGLAEPFLEADFAESRTVCRMSTGARRTVLPSVAAAAMFLTNSR
jgi:hypothetical protein